MKASLIAIVVLSAGAFAATPADERAFIVRVTRILKTEDGTALRQLVHWKGASPAAKEWFDLELGRAAGEADWHATFASAALEPIAFRRPPDFAMMKPSTLLRTWVLVVTFDGVGGGRATMRFGVGEVGGRLMITAPLNAPALPK